MEAGLMKSVLINLKVDWWKECCLNRSWIDERRRCQLEAGLMKQFVHK